MNIMEKITDWIVIIIPAIILIVYLVHWVKELKDNPRETIYLILYALCNIAGAGNLILISKVENLFFRLVLAAYGIISLYILFDWFDKRLHCLSCGCYGYSISRILRTVNALSRIILDL